MTEFEQALAARARSVEERLYALLPDGDDALSEAVRYSVQAGGKRLRPILMEETCRVFAGDALPEQLLYFMAAIEWIHTYSLVHDDLPVMDNDQYRRGKLTTHAAYGEAMGLLAGDALLNGAFELISRAFACEGQTERAARAFLLLAERAGLGGMIGGQAIDVVSCGKPLSIEVLEQMYRKKTSALLEAAMGAGALLGGADETQLAQVLTAAGELGLAFQIRDDILDVTSSQETLGKPIHSDEKNQKTTYCTLLGIEGAQEEARACSARAAESLRRLPGDITFLETLFAALCDRTK